MMQLILVIVVVVCSKPLFQIIGDNMQVENKPQEELFSLLKGWLL